MRRDERSRRDTLEAIPHLLLSFRLVPADVVIDEARELLRSDRSSVHAASDAKLATIQIGDGDVVRLSIAQGDPSGADGREVPATERDDDDSLADVPAALLTDVDEVLGSVAG